MSTCGSRSAAAGMSTTVPPSNAQVMGEETMTQRGAWAAYHRWFEDGRVAFMHDPAATGFEEVFQAASLRPRPATKPWADAYFAESARVAGLSLVTFDRARSRATAWPRIISS